MDTRNNLLEIVGVEHFSDDPEVLRKYSKDFSLVPSRMPNYVAKPKDEFNPLWVCHPPVPLAHDVFVERAEWMKSLKDWESPKMLPK